MVKDNELVAGLSRRDLLKRSAVAGSIVWASPAILASAAGASSHCPSGSCAVYHAVKLNTNDQPLPAEANICSVFQDVAQSDGTVSGFTCAGTTNGFVPPPGSSLTSTTCAQFQSHVASITREGDLDVITLEPGFQFVYAISKKGDCVDSIASGSCKVAKLRNNSSHIELIYCGPS